MSKSVLVEENIATETLQNLSVVEGGSSDQGVAPTTRFTKELGPEWIGCLVGLCVLFVPMAMVMGTTNMISTLMKTAYALLLDTCFYIMAIAVVCGALGSLFTEFGVVAMLNKLITPLMKPLFGLPGAASVGAIATFLSDNPAICTFIHNRGFMRYFKRYQIPALVNFGTCFGIGMIVVGAVLGLSGTNGVDTIVPAGIGSLCAILGGVLSTRLLLIPCARKFGKEQDAVDAYEMDDDGVELPEGKRAIREGGVYTGAAYEGVYFLPWLAGKIDFIITPLFGFTHMEALSVVATSLASAGASMSLVAGLLQSGLLGAKDIAVLTAICFCWSGFLSTHVPMLDDLKGTEFTGFAIVTHLVGGLAAGVLANVICMLIGIA